jgi:hypothetical protein
MSETFTDISGRTPETIDQATYNRSRRHQHAGPVSELVMASTRERYTAIGATHWQIVCDLGATVLRPVRVVG